MRDVGLQLELHLVEARVHLGECVVALAQLQVLLREHLVRGRVRVRGWGEG